MNNHIYSTLYKRLERKSDRSKETEQRKNHKTHTHKYIYINIYIYIYIYIYIKNIYFLNNKKLIKKIQNKKQNNNRTCDLNLLH